MSNVILVGYDDSPSSQRAVEFAKNMAKESGASLVVAHVLDWSPYSFLTPTELEERHKRRKEELSRAEDALLKPVVDSLTKDGIDASSVIRYGKIADTLCEIAIEKDAQQLIIGRIGEESVVARFFGSVASAVAMSSSVPCTIIP